MAFVREKRKGISIHYELVENKREGDKVKQKILKYFSTKKDMSDYCQKNDIPLPEETPIFDETTSKRVEEKLKKLNSLRPLPSAALKSLKEKFEVEMTYNSNAIEGNRLTLKETYLVLRKGMTIKGKSIEEHLEATNHKEALAFLESLVNKNEITEQDILEIHAIILDKINPKYAGFYRQEQVYIGGSKHIPPKWKEVPKLMRNIINEINSKEKGIRSIESAVKIHYDFVWIHPFIDGNGHLARLLCNLRLMRAHFPPIVLKKNIRKTYYDAMDRADEGDLKPLAQITIRDVEEALDLFISAAS